MKLCKPSFIFVNLLCACCCLVLLACYQTGNADNDSNIPWDTEMGYPDAKVVIQTYNTSDADTKIKVDDANIRTNTNTNTNNKPKTDAEIDVKEVVETKIVTRPPARHRPVALSCEDVHSPSDPGGIPDDNFGSCRQHADCTEGENGRCITTGVGYSANHYYCAYDKCLIDDDCDAGLVCYCTPNDAARCLSVGNCRVNADCGTGGYCSPSMGYDCGGYHSVDGYHCRTPEDTCVDDTDCSGLDYCDFNIYKNLWECTPINNSCAIG